MFDAMSLVIGSLGQRLKLRLQKKNKKSAAAKSPRFTCGNGGDRFIRFFSSTRAKKKLTGDGPRKQRSRRLAKEEEEEEEDGEEEESCVWRRAILMGRRCRPLEFAGAVHYDCKGRRLDRAALLPRPGALWSPPLRCALGHESAGP